jgi:hypothetical protein
VLLPSDTYRKPITSITDVLAPFLTYVFADYHVNHENGSAAGPTFVQRIYQSLLLAKTVHRRLTYSDEYCFVPCKIKTGGCFRSDTK